MAQLQWFKFYGGEYLSDPKMLSLTACERSCLLTLFCLASVSDIPGEIKYLNEYKLMIMSGLNFEYDEWNETLGVLDKFQKLNIVTLNDDETIKINNFRKKQDIALTGYERTKKYRQNNSDKIKAKSCVKKALEKGTLIKKPCEVCGNNNSEAHHKSYDKEHWLDVIWLCKKHHIDYDMITNDDAMKQNDYTREEESRVDKIRKEEKEKEKKDSSSLKKGKPFYENQEMRFSKGKWWVIPSSGGPWLEYADTKNKIEWK